MDMLISENLSPCASHMDDRIPAYVANGRWQPTRTGDFGADCDHGRVLAADIVRRMDQDSNPLHLNTVARAIVEAGRWEGVEVGLFTGLACTLIGARSQL